MDDILNKTIQTFDDWYSIRDELESIKKMYPMYQKDVQAISNAIEGYMKAVSKLTVSMNRDPRPAVKARIEENLQKANEILHQFQQQYLMLMLSGKR